LDTFVLAEHGSSVWKANPTARCAVRSRPPADDLLVSRIATWLQKLQKWRVTGVTRYSKDKIDRQQQEIVCGAAQALAIQACSSAGAETCPKRLWWSCSALGSEVKQGKFATGLRLTWAIERRRQRTRALMWCGSAVKSELGGIDLINCGPSIKASTR